VEQRPGAEPGERPSMARQSLLKIPAHRTGPLESVEHRHALLRGKPDVHKPTRRPFRVTGRGEREGRMIFQLHPILQLSELLFQLDPAACEHGDWLPTSAP
jgi:hypothetical protein